MCNGDGGHIIDSGVYNSRDDLDADVRPQGSGPYGYQGGFSATLTDDSGHSWAFVAQPHGPDEIFDNCLSGAEAALAPLRNFGFDIRCIPY